MVSAVTSFMGAKSNEFIGIEFNSGNLRLCLLKVQPVRKEVFALIEKSVQGLKEEEILNFIRKALAKFNLKSPKVIFIIPSEQVITKNIELPSKDPKEISDIVNLQASRHTPYGREEIAIDYINIGLTNKSYTKILLVIVNRDVVRKNFDILKKCGLEPEKITFASETITKAYVRYLKLEKEQVPVCTIHIDTAFSICNISLRDNLLFVRSIPIGIQHLTVEKERQQERFIQEIKQSLEMYKNENIDSLPSRIIITGAISEIKDMALLVNNTFKIPTDNVFYQNTFSFSEEALSSCESSKLSSFLGVISAAVSIDESKINLVPEEAKIRRRFEDRSREMIKTGALFLCIFIISCLWLLLKIYTKNTFMTQIDKKFEEIHKNAEVIEKDYQRVRIIRNNFSHRGHSIEVLGEFYKLLPDNIKITEVRFDKQKSFSFKGTAESMTDIFNFVEDLNKSNVFKESRTPFTSKRKEKDRDVTDFQIVTSFTQEAIEE
ncbi:MAG: pilus assembly protein PilM [Candidatus Omnitrophica bacterium]|nr:pilus assembly protein PilM [Candidatus Omnitrophota bacterium]